MPSFKPIATPRWIPIFFLIPLLAAGCDGGAASEGPDQTGGQPASGGSVGSGGAGTGGSAGTAGVGAGGTNGTGGSESSGGSKSSGGANGSGGAAGNTSSGGATETGGRNADGGRAASGGTAGSAAGGSPGGGAGGSSAAGSSTGGGSATGGSNGSGEYGFSYRKPSSHKFTCNSEVDIPDADWLCTFHVGGKLAYVYAQATAVGVKCVLASFGVYEVKLAQLSLDGTVTSLSDAAYDWGGGHHNDSLSFSYGGKTYKYYHSSFGFGFRSCQPMDCLNVSAPGETTPETEGCGASRTLPEVCVPIQANGSHAALVDKFMKCPGDQT